MTTKFLESIFEGSIPITIQERSTGVIQFWPEIRMITDIELLIALVMTAQQLNPEESLGESQARSIEIVRKTSTSFMEDGLDRVALRLALHTDRELGKRLNPLANKVALIDQTLVLLRTRN
ncbi:hypothetical protein KBD71_00645 [Candidatus Woesebacteria bacterium]|nr:hypothetical protein [Candidatus Woesebacteria bacterium]